MLLAIQLQAARIPCLERLLPATLGQLLSPACRVWLLRSLDTCREIACQWYLAFDDHIVDYCVVMFVNVWVFIVHKTMTNACVVVTEHASMLGFANALFDATRTKAPAREKA